MGYWDGWREFRYGAGRPVTLANVKAFGLDREPAARIRPRLQSAMDMLDDWRLSEFEHEAETFHMLRQWYLADNLTWAEAEDRAGRIIARAFRMLGVIRPAWIEGQRYFTAPATVCWNCGGEVSERDIERGYHYCCVACADEDMRRVITAGEKRDKWRQRMAYREGQRLKAEWRDCALCGTSYQNANPDAKYCSVQCTGRAAKLPEIACRCCGVVFKPQGRRNKFCSLSCASKFQVQEFRDKTPEQTCPRCLTIFRPGVKTAIYCSHKCAKRASTKPKPRVDIAARPLQQCPCCQVWFRKESNAQTLCSFTCVREMKRIRNSKTRVIPLTVGLFDQLFAEAA